MRIGFMGILVGISTALTLRKGESLTPTTVTLSLVTELLTLISLGVVEIS